MLHEFSETITPLLTYVRLSTESQHCSTILSPPIYQNFWLLHRILFKDRSSHETRMLSPIRRILRIPPWLGHPHLMGASFACRIWTLVAVESRCHRGHTVIDPRFRWWKVLKWFRLSHRSQVHLISRTPRVVSPAILSATPRARGCVNNLNGG